MPFRTLALSVLMAVTCLAQAQARDQSQTRADGPAMGAQRGGANGMDAQRGRALQEADAQQQEMLVRQKRRDMLRETLRVQAEEGPTTTRQLTAQEKIELRQQLRQQQEWTK